MRPHFQASRRTRGYLKTTLFAGAALFAAASAAAADSSSPQVAEVIVTAQKKSENLQTVPASVTALDTRGFSQGGIIRLEDYAALVPGLSLVSIKEGSTQITIRGITTGVAQSAAATAIYIDEAPVGSVNAYAAGTLLTPDLDPADLSQIEVLKGPQGTLYGAGAMGGLVKFVTVGPNFTTYSGRLAVSGDTIDGGASGYGVRGSVNLPLVADKLALRVSGFDREDPGFVSNVTGKTNDNDTRLDGARAELAWKPNAHLSVALSAMGQDTKDYGNPQETVSGVTLQPVYGDLKYQAYIPQPAYTQLRIFNGTVKGSWDGFNLTSSTTYETIKSQAVGDGTAGYGALLGYLFSIPDFGVKTTLVDQTHRFSQEFRLDSSLFDGKLDYQLGFFFTHEQDYLAIPGFYAFNTATLQPIPFPTIISAKIISRYTEYSGFANATYHVTDRFSLLAGVRYSGDDQHYRQDYSGLLVGPEIVSIGTSSSQVATWLVSPSYKINDDNMVYFRAASGYRPGGPNAVPPAVIGAPSSFQPDSLISYEAGYKADFFQRRLTLDAAAFYIDWSKIQIQTSQAGFNYYVNGGTAHSEGAELSLVAAPVTGLTIAANGAYTDSHLASPAPLAGGATGDELPFVPKWTFSISPSYRRQIAERWTGLIGGSVNYTGDRISDFSGRSPVRVPSFTTVNLNVGVEHDNYSLSLYAKNLNNDRGITYLKTLGLTPSSEPFVAGLIQPRTFGVELAAKF